MCVANSHWFRGPEDLPFDLRNRRGPITYLLAPDANASTKQSAKATLVRSLKEALRPFIEAEPPPTATHDETWITPERSAAQAGIHALGLAAHAEIVLRPRFTVAKSQLELVEAVRESQINTFGWPIGVLINTPEHKPKPFADGVRMEISAPDRGGGFGTTYDYWSLRKNGEFYLLKSLFEDTRAENTIFFNTRIVRVAEVLLFTEKLYRQLGAQDGAKSSVRVTHRNFAGRVLSSTGSRSILPASASENESSAEIEQTIGQVSQNLPNSVKSLLQPFFVLFDFKDFGDAIYEDIVRKFEQGQCT